MSLTYMSVDLKLICIYPSELVVKDTKEIIMYTSYLDINFYFDLVASDEGGVVEDGIFKDNFTGGWVVESVTCTNK